MFVDSYCCLSSRGADAICLTLFVPSYGFLFGAPSALPQAATIRGGRWHLQMFCNSVRWGGGHGCRDAWSQVWASNDSISFLLGMPVDAVWCTSTLSYAAAVASAANLVFSPLSTDDLRLHWLGQLTRRWHVIRAASAPGSVQ